MGRFTWLNRGVQDTRISQSGIKELFWVEVINYHPNYYHWPSDTKFIRIRPQRTLGSWENDKRQVTPKTLLSRVIWDNRKCEAVLRQCELRKALQIIPGSRIVICISCNMTMIVDKWPCIFNCRLAFAHLTLPLPVDVASKYFKEDVVELFKKTNLASEWLCVC